MRALAIALCVFCTCVCVAQEKAATDVYLGFSYLSIDTNKLSNRLNAYGEDFAFSYGLTKNAAVEGDFSTHYINNILHSGINAADLSYTGGPRINFGPIFIHSLFGGDSAITHDYSQNGVVFIEGGGVQAKISQRFSIRVSGDFAMSHHNIFNGPRVDQNNFRAGIGIVYHSRRSREDASVRDSSPSKQSSSGPRVSMEEIGLEGQFNADGFYVRSVRPGSPAANSGVAAGDTVVKVNGSPLQMQETGLPTTEGFVVLEITKPGWLSNQTVTRRIAIIQNAH